MQTHWRLAFMFDALDGDLDRLAAGLAAARGAILTAAAGHGVRFGTVIPVEDDNHGSAAHESSVWTTGDGAIAVMAGATHFMVPIKAGNTFLSLAFRRYPGTSVEQFRTWWHDQHAPLAIPALGEGLLAYDQVHVDREISRAAAEALGVADVEYDAYDNLTFASRAGFLEACSRDPEGMARLAVDEMGRIDDPTRRHALMLEI